MSITTHSRSLNEIIYPEDDGKPLSDHMARLRWIITIKEGLESQYADTTDVLIAGDLLWYPVEGNNRVRVAPNVTAVFGVSRRERGSYKQWEEGNTPPQVVFEILSPGNRSGEMVDKYIFYSRYGVEEYYLYDPFTNELSGWCGRSEREALIEPIDDPNGWVSPRLGIRFELPADGSELVLYHPDGSRFLSYLELKQSREKAESARLLAEQRATKAESETERLKARLRELGVDPDAI